MIPSYELIDEEVEKVAMDTCGTTEVQVGDNIISFKPMAVHTMTSQLTYITNTT